MENWLWDLKRELKAGYIIVETKLEKSPAHLEFQFFSEPCSGWTWHVANLLKNTVQQVVGREASFLKFKMAKYNNFKSHANV